MNVSFLKSVQNFSIIMLVLLSSNQASGCYFRSLSMSMFNSFKTSNALNKALSTMNGSINLSNTRMGNIKINGSANLGKPSEQTAFTDMLVVNGNLKSRHTSFETLEVNGNSELEHCSVAKQGEFFGNVFFKACKLNDLDLRGRDFILKDSTVTGSILLRAINGKGKLILDNTTVEGSAKFAENNGEIILKNGSRIQGNPSAKANM